MEQLNKAMQTHRFDFTHPNDPNQTEYRFEAQLSIDPENDAIVNVNVTRCVELETGLDIHFNDLDPDEQESAKEYAALLWGDERLPRFFPDEQEQARAYLEQCQDIANTAEYEADLAEAAYKRAMRNLKNAKIEAKTWSQLNA